MDRQIDLDRQMGGRINRQTDRETGRQKNGEAVRERDRKTARQ